MYNKTSGEVLRCLWFMLIGVVMLMICGCRLYFHVVALHVHTQRRCVMLCSKKQPLGVKPRNYVGWYSFLLTCMLQGHHHRLLNKVPLNEPTEVIPVHGEVW